MKYCEYALGFLTVYFNLTYLTFTKNMMHGSESGLLDPGLRRHTFMGGKVDPLIFRGSLIRLFLAPKWRLAVAGGSEF